jgi:hypothetical protein
VAWLNGYIRAHPGGQSVLRSCAWLSLRVDHTQNAGVWRKEMFNQSLVNKHFVNRSMEMNNSSHHLCDKEWEFFRSMFYFAVG